MEKKAIFLGVQKIHSNKTNKDYRKIDMYVPPYVTEQNFVRGGVVTVFTPLDSKVGQDIKVGTIVIPQYSYDGCSRYAELVGFKTVKETPYTALDFD